MNSDSNVTSSAAARAQPRQFGPHRVVLDGPIVVIWFVGDFTMQHWPQFTELISEVISRHGYAYAIGYLKDAGSIDPAVRKLAVAWLSQVALRGFANVQAGILARALAVLLGNAVRLVSGITLPSGFFETEGKAREWIASQEQRRKEHEISQSRKRR